jgi:hypothetical protein
MVIEMAVSIGAGIATRSVLLTAFGISCILEDFSAQGMAEASWGSIKIMDRDALQARTSV